MIGMATKDPGQVERRVGIISVLRRSTDSRIEIYIEDRVGGVRRLVRFIEIQSVSISVNQMIRTVHSMEIELHLLLFKHRHREAMERGV